MAADKNQAFSYEEKVHQDPLMSGFGAFTLQGSQVRNLHFPPRIPLKTKACKNCRPLFSRCRLWYGQSTDKCFKPLNENRVQCVV